MANALHLSREVTMKIFDSVKAPLAQSRQLLLMAWLAMLLLSRLPQIVLNYAWWGLGTAVLLIALTYIWPLVRPLRGYFLVMAAVALFTGVLDAPLRAGALWQNWFAAELGWTISFFGERLPLVLAALIIVLLLRLMGLKWADFFLVKEDQAADADVGYQRWPPNYWPVDSRRYAKGVFDLLINYFPQKTGDVTLLSKPRN
jgi:hypothetical protein